MYRVIIFSTYRLIEDWPNWPGKFVNIYGQVQEKHIFLKFLKKK